MIDDGQRQLRGKRDPGQVIEHQPAEPEPIEAPIAPAESEPRGPLWGDRQAPAINGHDSTAAKPAPRDDRVFEFDPASGKLRQVS